jgi:CBS domain-containing protein
VAIAGPIVSIMLFLLLRLASVVVPETSYLKMMLGDLARINLVLALFNLIPGLPLDGGNILKALVWKITGNPNKGIIFASRVGQFIGWLAIIIGGLGVLGVTKAGDFWTLLIGWFLLQNAGFSAQSAKVQETLNGYKAEDAIIPDSPIVSENLTLRDFVNNYVIGKREWQKFLVTDTEGKMLGVINLDELKKVPTSEWTEKYISEFVRLPENLITILASQSLLEVVKLLEQNNISQITVLRENGVVVGLLEKASVINFLQKQA